MASALANAPAKKSLRQLVGTCRHVIVLFGALAVVAVLLASTTGKALDYTESDGHKDGGTPSYLTSLALLTKKQYVRAILHRFISESGQSDAAVVSLMTKLDTDGDGVVDIPEFSHALKQAGFNAMSEQEIRALFGTFDLNGDGKLELSELQPMLQADFKGKSSHRQSKQEYEGQLQRSHSVSANGISAQGQALSSVGALDKILRDKMPS